MLTLKRVRVVEELFVDSSRNYSFTQLSIRILYSKSQTKRGEVRLQES